MELTPCLGVDLGLGMTLKTTQSRSSVCNSSHSINSMSPRRIASTRGCCSAPASGSTPYSTEFTVTDMRSSWFALSPRYAASSGAVLIMIQFTLQFACLGNTYEFAGSASPLLRIPNTSLLVLLALLDTCVAELERQHPVQWSPRIWSGLIPAINSNNG